MILYSLEVRSEITELNQVLQWLESTCAVLLTSMEFQQLEIVVSEAFTNVIKYAHKKLPAKTPVILDLFIEASLIEIRVWDQGEPFDFNQYLDTELHETPLNLSLQQQGHRGLLLIKYLTDDVTYETLGNHQNCLVMRKQFTGNLLRNSI